MYNQLQDFKMKHLKLLIAVFAGIIAITATSCTHYEEGPLFSVHTPEYRIIGSWQINHTYLNGEELDSCAYHANNPGTYYYFYADHVLSVTAFYNNMARESGFASYRLSDDNKQLLIDFTLARRYQYVADIKKLSRKELFYEYDDEYGNHWRLELYSRSASY